jgi:hypothetical protein
MKYQYQAAAILGFLVLAYILWKNSQEDAAKSVATQPTANNTPTRLIKITNIDQNGNPVTYYQRVAPAA